VDPRLVALAVPLFFALIAVERLVVRRREDRVYRLWDSICNLSCGVGQQALAIVLEAVVVGVYVTVHDRFALARWPMGSAIAWVGAFLFLDMQYYWFHRVSHRVNVIWATHAVHHQSEEYNLSVALRQSWFQPIQAVPFYLPLAIAGVPPVMFVTVHTLDILYQFWIHTRAVGRLGPLEWVLNTPSHHRVHHGIDPKYIDKNYAGTLIVWDRLFGTFKAEDEEPTYGTVKPLSSFNPTWANLEYWVEIARLAARCPRLADKLWAPFAPPEWRPKELGGPVAIPEASRATQKRYAVGPLPVATAAYAIVLFLQATAATLAIMLLQKEMKPPVLVGAVVLILWTLTTLSGLVERKVWAPPIESLRLGATLGLLLVVLGPAGLPWAAGGSLVMVVWLRLLRFAKVPARSGA